MLLQLFPFCVQEMEPLLKKRKHDLKWSFDDEVKNEDKKIEPPYFLGELPTYANNGHEEKVDKRRYQSLPIANRVDVGNKTDTV